MHLNANSTRMDKNVAVVISKKKKCFEKKCFKGGKTNSFTEGCIMFRTSSMNRHESTSDHIACFQSVNLKADMQKAMKRVHEGEDQFIHKLIKSVQWLVTKIYPYLNMTA